MARPATDLIGHIAFGSLEVLNAQPGGGEKCLKQGYREDDGLMMTSDADEQ